MDHLCLNHGGIAFIDTWGERNSPAKSVKKRRWTWFQHKWWALIQIIAVNSLPSLLAHQPVEWAGITQKKLGAGPIIHASMCRKWIVAADWISNLFFPQTRNPWWFLVIVVWRCFILLFVGDHSHSLWESALQVVEIWGCQEYLENASNVADVWCAGHRILGCTWSWRFEHHSLVTYWSTSQKVTEEMKGIMLKGPVECVRGRVYIDLITCRW